MAADVDLDATLIDETFTATTAVESQFVLQRFGHVPGLRVLDYGCGAAEGGIYLAKLGAKVVASGSPGCCRGCDAASSPQHEGST